MTIGFENEPRVILKAAMHPSKRLKSLLGIIFLASVFSPADQPPDPHQVTTVDGQAGSCSITLTVTDSKNAPVYDAKVRVHIAYGFMGVKRLDLEAATNIDGKARFTGLPEKVKNGLLTFEATKGEREGSATYDPGKTCTLENRVIVLKDK